MTFKYNGHFIISPLQIIRQPVKRRLEFSIHMYSFLSLNSYLETLVVIYSLPTSFYLNHLLDVMTKRVMEKVEGKLGTSKGPTTARRGERKQ